MIDGDKKMERIDEIRSMTPGQRKELCVRLRPVIFSYLHDLGYDTADGRKNIPCPVCDRGHRTPCSGVNRDTLMFHCFTCGRTLDVVGLHQELTHTDYYQALADIETNYPSNYPTIQTIRTVQNYPTIRTVQNNPNYPTIQNLDDPIRPSDEWIAKAEQYIHDCQTRIWKDAGKPGRQYMANRGITEETLWHFGIGYDPNRGGMIVIPTFVPYLVRGKEVTYPVRVQRRLMNPYEGVSKYQMVKDSIASAPFNGSALIHDPYIVMPEGEMDVLILWQEGRKVASAVTFGSADFAPNPKPWRDYLKCPEYICVCGDSDTAGDRGDDKTLEAIQRLINIRGAERTDEHHVFRRTLPDTVNGIHVKDWNDYYQAGGNIPALLDELFQFTD